MLVKMKIEKETKNSVRYKEEEDDMPIIGTLYLKKWSLKQEFGDYPKNLEVTIKKPE